MIKAFRKIQTDDRKLMQVQEAVASVVNPLVRVPLIDGVLVENVSITTAGVTVNHLLGRQPRGWFVVDSTADVRVWRTAWTDRLLTLDASGTSTIAVWVF